MYIVLLAKSYEDTKKALALVESYDYSLVLVDLGLDNLPSLPSGISLTYYRIDKGIPYAEAINKIVYNLDRDFYLILDKGYDSIRYVNFLSQQIASYPKIGAITISNSVGTQQVDRVPLFGTLYRRNCFRDAGTFDPLIRDLSLLSYTWSQKALKKGWAFLQTYIELDDIIVTEDFSLNFLRLKALDEKDESYLTPNPLKTRPWEGDQVRPWNKKVTVCLPNYKTSLRQLRIALESWKCQTVSPYIDIRDCGSGISYINDLLSFEQPGVEVHFNRWQGHLNLCDFQALSLEHSLSDCRTPYLLITHPDVFPLSQTVLADLMSLCNERNPVVGYSNDLGQLNTTLTMFHIDSFDRSRLTLNSRWLRNCSTKRHTNGSSLEVGETLNEILRVSSIKPKVLGKEIKGKRNLTQHFDHVGSATSNQFLNRDQIYRSNADLESALNEADLRLRKWQEI